MNRPAAVTRCRAMPRHQHGVVLFVALIAMVVLSLAGVALLRTVDTNQSVAGNLAFRQASINAINDAVEKATDDLFIKGNIVNPFNDDLAHNYYANLRPGEQPSTGIPAALYGPTPPYPVAFQTYTSPTGMKARWVIERMCQGSAPAPGPYYGDPTTVTGMIACDLLTPKVGSGRTTMKPGEIPVPPVPLYRVTIRVDGPSNTASFAQAMLR